MKTRVHIWQDQTGKIIAVGKPAEHMRDRVEPIAADPNHAVIATDVEDAEIATMLKTYSVNVASAQLRLNE